ncbi:MAG: DUF4278 domain-containing protein [Cyanobacteria bacterium J06635_1]
MQLNYRGNRYAAHISNLNVTETDTSMTYRGVQYRLRQNGTPEQPPKHMLRYRGVAYFK